jgi:diguanylate cyclase (GGDEF)-like protein
MISIKRLLDGKSEAGDPAFFRLASLLLEAIAIHAVNCDAARFAAFRDGIRSIRLEVEQAESTAHALLLSGEAVHSMEVYNRDIEAYVRNQGQEFRQIMRMLAHSLLEVSQASDTASGRLRQIEKEIESASRLDELALIRAKLNDSLEALAEENSRQRKQATALAGHLREQLTAVCSQAEHRLDPVTGLPDSAAAVAEIEEVLAAGEGRDAAYAAVFRLERLDAINARFGFAVGDRMLLACAQHLGQQLGGSDKLYRWRGPALVAVLSRTVRRQDVRLEVSRIASKRHEELIEMNNRTMLLPLSCTATTIPIGEHASIESVVRTIDGFLQAFAHAVQA